MMTSSTIDNGITEHVWRATPATARYVERVNKTVLGQRLRALRTEAGLTQQQLAERLDGRQSTVSAIETGVNEATVTMIWAWANACGRYARLEFHRPAEAQSEFQDAIAHLSSQDLALLTRAARALPGVEPAMKAGVVQGLENLAGVGSSAPAKK